MRARGARSQAAAVMNIQRLAEWVSDARQRTVELASDLTDEQLMGPRLDLVNPLRWEIGHVAWFQEKWVLRHVCGEESSRNDADALYDSIAIAHDKRWDLPLPSRQQTLAYMCEVRDRVLEKLQQAEPSEALVYFVLYTTFHEDMHNEAFTYTRQTLGYPPPRLSLFEPEKMTWSRDESPLAGDAQVPGGMYLLGAAPQEPFVFDNEKWAHLVQVKPFAMARAAVTQSEFVAFVEDAGYRRKEYWSEEGWRWREAADARHPLHWRRDTNGAWLRRDFDQWVGLELYRPMIHVNWFEADAYCRRAGRRLPTEVEWEVAASGESEEPRRLSAPKRRFPWGDDPPTPECANLDWRAMGCAGVGAFPEGDSAFGCRQMVGNVWEWTSTTFRPYPGFVSDAYKEYSEPWFETRKVLRGGCWATRSRLLRNTYRNFYCPDRRDVLAGFRTCRSVE